MNTKEAPVPAVRRLHKEKASSGAQARQTGLLINVIRSLTSSASVDQRELEKARLQKGFHESEILIDRLVKDHQNDVEDCLDSFRDVSTRILGCRERIHNVRNALQTCKSLMECRRDDLKKLWMENAQQKQICEIMAQLENLREAPSQIEVAMNAGQFQEAASIVCSSRELLEDRLSTIEGLSQLRMNLEKSTVLLTNCIIDTIVNLLVVVPFETHMFDIIRSMPQQRIEESDQCKVLAEKVSHVDNSDHLSSRLVILIGALTKLEGDSLDIDKLLSLCASQFEKQITLSLSLMRTRVSADNLEGDQTHLTQLIQMVVNQWESCRAAHAMLAEICASFPIGERIMSSFFDFSQSAIEALVSDHLDITPLASKEPLESRKLLFRFESTAYAGKTSSSSSTTQGTLVMCPPSAFNIVAMFPWLRKLMESIEKHTGESNCKLRRFTHSFVMELFVERVKSGLAVKMEQAVRSSENVKGDKFQAIKVLPSCERVFDLCKEVHSLILNMDLYADRFAALWLLLLTEYNKNVTSMYEKTTLSLGDIDGIAARRKISAAWTADQDISRLLMSLPNWEMAATRSSIMSPTTPALESEQDIRLRNERESDILIGNLGTQKKIDSAELVTDMGDVRALASLHESLRWFAVETRELVKSLPTGVKNSLAGCMVQVRFKDGQVTENEAVLKATEDSIRRLESISESCLLMLHLELRVHCFYHLLPLSRPKNINVQDEIDPEVVELGRDLQSFYSLLSEILSPPKLRYIFDGLGHLCGAIFIHTSQHMPRLSDSGKKRICRNVWGVQQRLSQLTSRRETALDRARAYFELLSHDPDVLLTLLPDKRNEFSPVEMGYLVALSVRSHAVLANQPGALEQRMAQLSAILRQTR